MTENKTPQESPPTNTPRQARSAQEDTRASLVDSTRRIDVPQIPQPPQNRPRATAPPPSSQRGRARTRRDSGLYLPLWSLILMMFFVLAAAVGIVLLVVALGGNRAPESNPIVIVSSPIPTTRPGSFPLSPATATLPPEAASLRNRPQVTFALSGPTLPPVEISPTPQRIILGGKIEVIDVGTNQLNVRDAAGVIGTVIVFLADEGSVFSVVDGPQQADGLTWWKIQDPNNATRSGWAASNYLLPVTTP